MLNVKEFHFHSTEWKSNTYIVYDENSSCIIIDASDSSKVLAFVKENNLNCKAIYLTHGHFDHIKALDELVKELNCPVYIDLEDSSFLKDVSLNCSMYCNEHVIINIDKTINALEAENENHLNEKVIIYRTPFHTMGSINYYFPKSKIIFSGDTLFKGSIGRTDLPTSNSKLIKDSLKIYKELPHDVVVYPGHGVPSTIFNELNENPYLSKI
ncbi:MAG: MBL fold metallo-hydrolase [Bacilli bacterium]